MATDILETSREARGWAKLLQNAESAKKIEALTASLGGLTTAFANVNREMVGFNENSTKANKFLGKIARLTESIEKQTKAAEWTNRLVIGLAVLQVILAVVQIWLKK